MVQVCEVDSSICVRHMEGGGVCRRLQCSRCGKAAGSGYGSVVAW